MRSRFLTMLLVALALLIAACDDNEVADNPSESPDDAQTDQPAALDEGLAATVGDREIAEEDVESRYQAVAETEGAREALEGQDAEAVKVQLRASILSRLILGEIVRAGAEDLGVEITEEDIAQRQSEFAEEAGGEDAFNEQLEAAGVTEAQLQEELHTIVALERIEAELAPEGGESETADPEATESEAANAGEEWLFERVAASDVAVSPEYGTWSPETGQVVPAMPEGEALPQLTPTPEGSPGS